MRRFPGPKQYRPANRLLNRGLPNFIRCSVPARTVASSIADPNPGQRDEPGASRNCLASERGVDAACASHRPCNVAEFPRRRESANAEAASRACVKNTRMRNPPRSRRRPRPRNRLQNRGGGRTETRVFSRRLSRPRPWLDLHRAPNAQRCRDGLPIQNLSSPKPALKLRIDRARTRGACLLWRSLT